MIDLQSALISLQFAVINLQFNAITLQFAVINFQWPVKIARLTADIFEDKFPGHFTNFGIILQFAVTFLPSRAKIFL